MSNYELHRGERRILFSCLNSLLSLNKALHIRTPASPSTADISALPQGKLGEQIYRGPNFVKGIDSRGGARRSPLQGALQAPAVCFVLGEAAVVVVAVGGGGLFTLQVKLALGALQEDGADRVQIVVAAASQRPGPCLRHLQEN